MNILEKKTATKIDTGYGEFIYKLAKVGHNNLNKHDVSYVEIGPGKSSRKHFHSRHEETYYIISGQALMGLDQEEAILNPGQLVVIQPGAVHKITNLSTELLCLLVTCAPGWTDDDIIYVD